MFLLHAYNPPSTTNSMMVTMMMVMMTMTEQHDSTLFAVGT